jgi:hypothetical protein
MDLSLIRKTLTPESKIIRKQYEALQTCDYLAGFMFKLLCSFLIEKLIFF